MLIFENILIINFFYSITALEPTEVPHFKIPLSNAMARVGQKIKLEALIGGIPRPDIFWMHNGKPYVPRDSKVSINIQLYLRY